MLSAAVTLGDEGRPARLPACDDLPEGLVRVSRWAAFPNDIKGTGVGLYPLTATSSETLQTVGEHNPQTLSCKRHQPNPFMGEDGSKVTV